VLCPEISALLFEASSQAKTLGKNGCSRFSSSIEGRQLREENRGWRFPRSKTWERDRVFVVSPTLTRASRG